MPRMIRILVYEGPQEWLDLIKKNNFVQGARSVSDGKTIHELLQSDIADPPTSAFEQRMDE